MSIISKRGIVVEMFIVNCKAGVLTDLNVCMYVHAFYIAISFSLTIHLYGTEIRRPK